MQFQRRPIPWFHLILVALSGTVLLFIVAPVGNLLLSSSMPEISRATADKELIASIRLTLGAALVASLFGSLGGVPLGYLLARKRFWGRAILLAIIDVPIIIPHSAAGIALLTVIGRQSFFGDGLVGTFSGISVAMAFVSIPFLVNAARAGFTAVPERLEKTARTLGAGPFRAFLTVALPLAWPDILSGMILMWARGISEFGAVIIIAYHPMTTPVLIFQRFNDFGLSYARSAAVVLIVICLIIFTVLRFVSRKRRSERSLDA